jgi:hypothetical protein
VSEGFGGESAAKVTMVLDALSDGRSLSLAAFGRLLIRMLNYGVIERA